MLPDDLDSNGRPGPSRPVPAGEPAALSPRDKDEYAKHNLLKIPSIQQPKGGGALKSIDEKFRVNSANGTATCSIPIPLSATRNNFAPSVTLDYNSGSGNGPFGLGWNISLTSIRRRTDKLMPTYQDASNSDTFQLSGAEDLVPTLTQNSGGEWLPDQFTTGHYLIKRFRPRIDSAFTLIEQITSPNGIYWKTTTRDNVVMFFGLSPSGRVADPRDPTHVFEWWPEISFDDKGNCFQFFYVPEDLQNVPHLLHEANRLNGNQPFSNIYLKRIAYGNTAPYSPVASGGTPDPYLPVIPDGTGYLFSLILDYGDHDSDNPAPTPATSWGCRLDPFSNCKPGFDWRTYRLCRRFLSFHQFAELDAEPVMVRSIDLTYRSYDFTPVADPYTLQFVEADLLVSATLTGWTGKHSTGYQRSSYPPAAFTYQLPTWNSAVQSIDAANRMNIPQGLIAPYQFTDLYDEGISGILSEQQEGWYYNSNLGDGVFTPASLVAPKPSFTGLKNGSLQLQSLTADGRKFIVSTSPPNLGYFELTSEGDWLPFMAFGQYPALDTRDPNVKFIDLNGDGMPEIILSEEQVFMWYPSMGITGYDSPELAPKPFDEEKGPAIVFADPVQSIFLADMNGDGLSDIVRIRNGEISYWPNQGFGIFGAKVNMTNAPLFDTIDAFNPAYIQLSDINGTGCTDLLYLGQDKLRAWLNLSGNAWGDPFEAPAFPHTANPNQLSVADLLGNGTACIIWSSPLVANADAPLQYIDLMNGRKPYLMSAYANGMGKLVTLTYKSSTWYYLQDKLSGTPWITQLCFPVQCVASVLITDSVSGAQYSSAYSYHHGYYDHPEKEYRGFGRVDQTDTDNFDTNAVADQVPMLTRTWFHTGFYYRMGTILHQLAEEYFQNPAFTEYTLPEPGLPINLTADEAREAARACKGMVLRQEVYALDDTANPTLANYPYSAAEHNNTIILLQPQSSNPYAAFLSVESESISYNYERNPADPRIAHTLNTAFDSYGNIIDSYAVTYPRQPVNPSDPGGIPLPGNQPLPAPVIAEQAKTYIIYTHHGYTTQIITAATYRLPASCETITWQWTGAPPSTGYYSITDFTHPSSPPSLTRLKHQRTLFLRNDLVTPLPLNTMDSLGFPYQQYHLAIDAQVTALTGKTTPAMLQSAAYIESDTYKGLGYFPSTDASGEWWVPAGTIQYLDKGAPQPFYQPYQYLDVFGYATTIGFDAYWLIMNSVTDAVGNTTTVPGFDYRVLQPRTVLDANNNATDYHHDILGHTVGIALRGKGEGDVFDPGFTPDLTAAQIQGFFSDPFTNGPPLLQGATMRYVYVFPSLADPSLPFSTGAISRYFHANRYVDSRIPIPDTPYQFSFEYTDGLGRIAMKKTQADLNTGTSSSGSCDGGAPPVHNWIGNGKTVYNNKGKPVMQYEPFFSTTPAYEEAPSNGVTAVLHYDPPGRPVRTDLPDGSFFMTTFNPWVQIAYDQNDTVKDSLWYQQHMLSPDPKMVDAATKAAADYNTPAANHLDPLGRNFYSVAFNIVAGVNQFYSTQTVLDLQNNPLQVIDPMGNTVTRSDYDLLDRPIHTISMDAGERWNFVDSMNNPSYKWDHNDTDDLVYTFSYDQLHRILQSVIRINGTPYLSAVNIYGEGIVIQAVPDIANNLRGRLYRQFDNSGLLTHYSFDFKGNLVQSSRIFAKTFSAADPLAPPVPWTGGAADLSLLENEEFMTLAGFDVLNRPLIQTRPFLPATSGALIPPPYNQVAVNNADIKILGYGESGGLLTVHLYYNGGIVATPYVVNIRHNEKGQRLCIQYGNNTVIRYTYDPDTFRLLRQLTTAISGTTTLQDLNYYYDPVGNITYMIDKAQPAAPYNNQQTLSDADYTYDPVYRLIRATGREQIAQNTVNESPSNTDYRNFPYEAITPLPAPTDALAMRPYTQLYSYDAVNNMTTLQHAAGTGSYTRVFAYNNNTADRTAFGISPATPMNNRLLATTLGGSAPVKYTYDEHGNTTQLVQLSSIAWNSRDQLVSSAQQVVVSGSGQTTYYTYDEAGARTRKITVAATAGGGQPPILYERLYLGNFEIYRGYDSTGRLLLERETLHIVDDKNRVATIDKKTLDVNNTDPAPLNAYQPRYQYGNHLGSAMVELDGAAAIITYEEYHPFGTTSFESADGSLDVPAKRYRYIGKERDEETGLCYHGARYYAPWLGRWLSCDPAGIAAGLNFYTYCTDNPIMHRDEDGMQETNPPCHTSCHHSDSPTLKSSLMSMPPPPPPSAEEIAAVYANQQKAQAEAAQKAADDAEIAKQKEEEKKLGAAQIYKADKEQMTGTVCQHSCHGLRGLKNVTGDPKQMNADAMLFVQGATLPLMLVGGAEYGFFRGIVVPLVVSTAADEGTQYTARAMGVDKDKAALLGFGVGLIAGGLSMRGAARIPGGFEPPPMWKPEAGKEVFVGEWLNQNLQRQVDTSVQRFESDPSAMAKLVPPSHPYLSIPQYSGLAIEYGTKESIAKTPIIGDIIDPIPAQAQNVPGGRGDLQLNASFQQWGLKEWDITTFPQIAVKEAAGKDRTWLPYVLNQPKMLSNLK